MDEIGEELVGDLHSLTSRLATVLENAEALKRFLKKCQPDVAWGEEIEPIPETPFYVLYDEDETVGTIKVLHHGTDITRFVTEDIKNKAKQTAYPQ